MAKTAEEIKSKRGSIEYFAKHFEAEKAKLFNPNGKPIYSDDEMKKRTAAALQPLRETVESTLKFAQDVQAKAKKTATLRHVDPILSLKGEDLQRAALLAPFIKDTVTQGKPESLHQAATAAATTGDSVATLLYRRYINEQQEAIMMLARTGQLTPDKNEQVNVFRVIFEDLNTIAPIDDGDIKQAEQDSNEAVELDMFARRTLAIADGTDAQARANFAKMVKERF